MAERTPLYPEHVAAGARMVVFGGWDMPVYYASALSEHHAVRRGWGIFDVSHMTVVDVEGSGARDYLRRLLANDVARLREPGHGLYSCMLNEAGGVVDDLITYWLGGDRYRVIVNAATRDKDLAWMRAAAAGAAVSVTHRAGVVMIAVQGPAARSGVAALLPPAVAGRALALRPFHGLEAGGTFIARTGYTGEDGFEIVTDAADGVGLWRRLVAAGAMPCGLGARDTLRLEAGLNLYGQDMDETTSPLVSGLAWTVALDPADRDFIGRPALARERAVPPRQAFTGVLLEDRGVMRHGMRVCTSAGDGIVTSGGFAPTLDRSIGLARVPHGAGPEASVEIRGVLKPARLVRPPFVRHGRNLLADGAATAAAPPAKPTPESDPS
jgi:aminomethyltransferase